MRRAAVLLSRLSYIAICDDVSAPCGKTVGKTVLETTVLTPRPSGQSLARRPPWPTRAHVNRCLFLELSSRRALAWRCAASSADFRIASEQAARSFFYQPGGEGAGKTRITARQNASGAGRGNADRFRSGDRPRALREQAVAGARSAPTGARRDVAGRRDRVHRCHSPSGAAA